LTDLSSVMRWYNLWTTVYMMGRKTNHCYAYDDVKRWFIACDHDTSDSWRSTVNKDFANWRGLDCWKMIIEFPLRQWKWHMLFDLLQINWLRKKVAWYRRRTEWTDSNIASRILVVEMVSII